MKIKISPIDPPRVFSKNKSFDRQSYEDTKGLSIDYLKDVYRGQIVMYSIVLPIWFALGWFVLYNLYKVQPLIVFVFFLLAHLVILSLMTSCLFSSARMLLFVKTKEKIAKLREARFS